MTKISFLERLARNPAFGLFPFFIYSFILGYIDPTLAAIIAFALSLIGALVVKSNSRLIYYVSIFTFVFAFLISFTTYRYLSLINTFIVVEVIFTFFLTLTRLSRGRLFLFAKNDINKTLLKESFRVVFQTQYSLTIHLFVFIVYLVTTEIAIYPLSALFMKVTFQLILLGIMSIETTRLYILSKKLFNEEWLPVVTETGEVTGRVAKSVTKDMKNKFMHPVVRVALLNNGAIYLKKRDKTRVLNPGKLDYPFEEYMEFNDELDRAVKESLGKECGNDKLPVRFLLKYTFENEITKRLIFLYVAEIEDDALFNCLNLQGGKLWTTAQIEDNMGSDIFSECFELEFEYLKNTLLLVHKYKNKKNDN